MHVIDGSKLSIGSEHKASQEVKTFVKIIQPLLDDRFALVHTLSAGRRGVVDALLVGPHGALVMKVDGSSGRYRCLGDSWYSWDQKAQDFSELAQNPIDELKRSLEFVEATLQAQGMGAKVPTQGVVVFVDKKLQVEHMEPAVPLVTRDKLKPLAAELMDSPVYIETREIEKVLSVFGARAHIAPARQSPAPEASLEDGTSPGMAHSSGWMQQNGPFGLKRWQFLALLVLFLANMCVLGLGLYLVLFA
ncbi:MAG: NERD domain-containing protein [Thermoflexales bacterium]|nr:NERD domain-containing protein [Thermoflexales bacterium]